MKTKLTLLGILASLFIYSCQKGSGFLDKKIVALNQQQTFADSANTTAFLSTIYSDAWFYFNIGRYDCGGNSVASDESISYAYTGPQNDGVLMALGAISAATADVPKNVQILNSWKTCWVDIRRVNVFLANVDHSPLSAARKTKFKAEARFLRAWYYSLLLKGYGGVPLIGDQVFAADGNFDLQRSSYSDCVNYVVSELDAAAAILPTYATQLPEDYGRATQGACMAVKAKVLLYAASPLFNGSGVSTPGDVTEYPSYDKERWNTAAKAALAVMNTGLYDIYVDNTTRPGYGYYAVFQKRVNNEYIFTGMTGPNRTYENLLLPPSRTGNSSSQVAVPTQTMVDSYLMKNGLPITDPASGYDPANPYANRDPRFDNSIIHNASSFFYTTTGTKSPIYTYVSSGTPDQFDNGKTNNTGYYWRKMCFEDGSGNTDRCYPLIRYGEILLDYAEAVNEYQGPTAEVYNTLIKIRTRAGIDPGPANMYGLKPGMTQAQMRSVIQNERMIELSLEEHRMWDLRRWKIADGPLNSMGNGMRITKSGAVYTYNVVNITTRAFYPQFYLFPIPQSEISKSPKLIQNPGW